MKDYNLDGRVFYQDGKWFLDAEPNILVFFNRMFPSCQVQTIYFWTKDHAIFKYTNRPRFIRDRPIIRKDINWFLLRFKIQISKEDKDLLDKGEKHYDEQQVLLRKSFYEPNINLKLALPLRDYQKQAVALALHKGSLLIADQVGLGKTPTGIAIAYKNTPCLVVVPPHLVTQWEEEIKKFIPDAKVHKIMTGKNYTLPKADFYINSYTRVYKWERQFTRDIIPRTLIMDEVHSLRRNNTKKYEAIDLIAQKVDYKIGLSATPIMNYGSEIFNIYGIISPDFLGKREDFMREWCDSYSQSIKDPEHFGNYLKKNMMIVRRTRQDVKIQLDPVQRTVYDVDADLETLKKFEQEAKALAMKVITGDFHEAGQASREFDWKMRQMTGVAKAKAVAEVVKMILHSGEKVVLFGWHRECFGKGTKILMYDGTIKKIENIIVGDKVMGPDSKPRTVKSLVSGKGNLWKVTPKKGKSWVCSENHILALHRSEKNCKKKVKMTAKEFSNLSERTARGYCIYRSEEISFSNKKVIEPWFLGYWLGDGVSRLNDLRICTADKEVVEELKMISKRNNIFIKKYKISNNEACAFYSLPANLKVKTKKKNKLLTHFRKLKLHRNKHIPYEYKTSSIKDRRELLAGLIDSDGYVYKSNSKGTIDFSNKNKTLCEDVAFISRSLGLAAYIKTVTRKTQMNKNKETYYRVSISGDITTLPMRIKRKNPPKRNQIKNVLRTGFSLKENGEGVYYGFEVDGDNLFLLDDFTVVHNCYSIWMKALADYNPVLYTGTENNKKKEESRKKFIEGTAKVFIMSLRSGAGLNGLQNVASYCVFGELDWSPAVIDQCIGRLWRDGQKDQVNAIFVTVNDGADPHMQKILGLKSEQASKIIDPEKKLDATFTTSENKISQFAKSYLKAKGENVDKLLEQRAKKKNGILIEAPKQGQPYFSLYQDLKRVVLHNEKEKALQYHLAESLEQLNYSFKREVKISEKSIVDFLLYGEIIIECKTKKFSKPDLLRQIKRYKEELKGLRVIFLFTPETINHFKLDGIPVYAINFSKNSLLLSGLS